MHKLLAMLLLCLPLASGAQSWRLQVSGGAGISLLAGRASSIFIGPYSTTHVTSGFYAGHVGEFSTPSGIAGLSLLRQSGVLEYGVQVEAFTAAWRDRHFYATYPSNGPATTHPYELTSYGGRPIIPVTAVCNYYAGPKRSSAFVGVHLGIARSFGKDQIEFEEFALASTMRIHYHSAWGYSAGIQAGYRKEIGAMDLGFQMQAKYLHFELRHGSNETRYPTRMVILPVQLYAGYRFGKSQPKPAPSSDSAPD